VEDTFQGQAYVPFATTGLVIKARPGRLSKVVVTAAVTGSLTFYDNATAAAGQLLWVSPATPTIGQIFVLDIPARAGIYLTPGSAGAGLVVIS
jgi:hypothetical protein